MKYQKGKRILEPLDSSIEQMLIDAGWEPIKENATISKAETVDYDEMTKAEIMNLLKEKGIKFSDRDSKPKLIELLK